MENICYVYIIGTATGAYKIGVASDPWARHDALRAGIPDPSEILLMITCRNRKHAFAVESGLHRELDQYRSAGEWFRPPKNILGELILELGSRIEALSADILTIAYAAKTSPTEMDQDAIVYGCRQSTRDRKRAIMNIFLELNGEREEVHEDAILSRAEDLGIDRIKATETLDRLRRDGELGGSRPKTIRIII